MMSDLATAKEMARTDPGSGWAALNSVFRAGSPPAHPLSGKYAGELTLVEFAPGLSKLVRAIAHLWLPWKGKFFDAREGVGDNIFAQDSRIIAQLFTPLYRGFRPDTVATYRAYAFRTRLAPGLFDADRIVLKIDYDLEGNPGLTIRRVLDELVQISDTFYLGKAHLKWWWGRWQTVAFFTLRGAMQDSSPAI
jgi:hypothetical protein